MKTAEELGKELNKHITKIIGKKIYKDKNLIAIFKDFEKEIREDQDLKSKALPSQ